ncbi:hypothetical protein TNCV_3836881 [Trichonephila clavipes]|nr:hypothetical protein TNCV_3836881 [Trichonephila clavipes]
MHVKSTRAQNRLVGMVWKLREVLPAQASPSLLNQDSKLQGDPWQFIINIPCNPGGATSTATMQSLIYITTGLLILISLQGVLDLGKEVASIVGIADPL